MQSAARRAKLAPIYPLRRRPAGGDGVLHIYNTLTKSIDEIRPISPGRVTMYTCGPTVYRYAHIGNLRTYLMADWIRRILAAAGCAVYHIKNITDVGHMRQELVEAGGDKMILAALAEGKTVAEIAQFYADCFRRDEGTHQYSARPCVPLGIAAHPRNAGDGRRPDGQRRRLRSRRQHLL